MLIIPSSTITSPQPTITPQPMRLASANPSVNDPTMLDVTSDPSTATPSAEPTWRQRDTPDFAFDSIGQVHLDRWSSGRVALVGDAGYCTTPLTGLGTSLALVGAYVLAGELAAADHRTALRRYEEVLRPYVSQAQELPPGGPRSALAIRLRAPAVREGRRDRVAGLLPSPLTQSVDPVR